MNADNEYTTAGIVARHAASNPHDLAILGIEEEPLEAAELDAFTSRVARSLASWGITTGDRVAIALRNGPTIATAFLSVTRAAVAAPLNPRFTKSEFLFYLDDLHPAAVIVAEPDTTNCTEAADELGISIIALSDAPDGPAGTFMMSIPDAAQSDDPSPHPEDVALVLHTSGTTGRPKIVPLSHGNLHRSAHNVAMTLGLTAHDRCLNMMPLFHIHGLVAALLSSLIGGGSVVCTPGFNAAAFPEWLDSFQPTWYTAVPTMHQAVLKRASLDGLEAPIPSTLRFIRSSSAPLAPSVLEQLEQTFDVPVVEAYGMTEAAHQMTSNPLPPAMRKLGSVGPGAGVEVRIASGDGAFLGNGEIGEVVVRGTNVTIGYLGGTDRSSAFFPDNWFRTGDQGYLDDDGYLFLTGRLKEIINRGGESIAPREIDEVLLDHPSVVEAIAFAVPDRDLGEEVAAAVVASDRSTTENDLREFAAGRLTFSKVPKRVILVDEIPKGPTGKLQRIGLADVLGLTTVVQPAEDSAGNLGVGLTAAAEVVATFWSEILKMETVDADTMFLELGGDSLAATALVIKIEERYGIELPLMEFYDAATVRFQGALIDRILGHPET